MLSIIATIYKLSSYIAVYGINISNVCILQLIFWEINLDCHNFLAWVFRILNIYF